MKLIVFLPLIIFFAIFFILIIGFLGLIIKLVKKGRDSSWTGTLIDKKYFEKSKIDSKLKDHFYTLIFDAGKDRPIKVGVSREIYDSYKVGDKAEKIKGELYIKKLS